MEELRDIIIQLSRCIPSEIYIIGGCLRNYLLNRGCKDIDIVLEKNAVQAAKEFAKYHQAQLVTLDEKAGMARVIFKDKGLIIDFSDMKGCTIQEDLRNRDFTMNALALKVRRDGVFYFDDIIDIFQGRDDIKNRKIRVVNENAFKEDPLRMLRAVRFMAELDFDLEENTMHLIRKHASEISQVVGESVSHELFHLLESQRTHYYFTFMDNELNLLDKIFPEIVPMKKVGQCDYHVVDSWRHSLYTLKQVEKIIYAYGYFECHVAEAYEKHMQEIVGGNHTRKQLVKLAALFHDIGKPGSKWIDEYGKIRFRGHEIVGMEIMGEISERLNLSGKEKRYLCKMVKEHMWPLALYKMNDVSGKATYDLFKNFGDDTLDVLLIGLADIISTRKLLNPHEAMGMHKIHAEYLANNYLTRFKTIMDISDIFDGEDIIKNFEISDEDMINELFEEVRKAIFYGIIPPQKDSALRYLVENFFKKEN
ncbi:HD domain-containing protein [Clostridiaceae bacterium 35-E11]